jgi:hypothetical protein
VREEVIAGKLPVIPLRLSEEKTVMKRAPSERTFRF